MARQLRGVDVLYKNLTIGRDWLLEMGSAAEKLGISIQYGNAYPRQALQALHIKSVTQVATIEKINAREHCRILCLNRYTNISIFNSFNRNFSLGNTSVSQPSYPNAYMMELKAFEASWPIPFLINRFAALKGFQFYYYLIAC